MSEQDPQEEPKRVPARRRAGAGPVDVFVGDGAYQINEGDILEVGVWPWEITEEHGWERVTQREARAARSERREAEAETVEALTEAVAEQQTSPEEVA